jgi:hypothetical protein
MIAFARANRVYRRGATYSVTVNTTLGVRKEEPAAAGKR